MATPRIRDIFGMGFWLNYALSLLLTLWIPFAHLKFVNESGEVLRESYPPVYKIYLDLVQDPTMFSVYKYVAAHWLIVFFVTAAVWYSVLRLRSPNDETEATDA